MNTLSINGRIVTTFEDVVETDDMILVDFSVYFDDYQEKWLLEVIEAFDPFQDTNAEQNRLIDTWIAS